MHKHWFIKGSLKLSLHPIKNFSTQQRIHASTHLFGESCIRDITKINWHTHKRKNKWGNTNVKTKKAQASHRPPHSAATQFWSSGTSEPAVVTCCQTLLFLPFQTFQNCDHQDGRYWPLFLTECGFRAIAHQAWISWSLARIVWMLRLAQERSKCHTSFAKLQFRHKWAAVSSSWSHKTEIGLHGQFLAKSCCFKHSYLDM